jgi:cation diffusion facilitator family transporter
MSELGRIAAASIAIGLAVLGLKAAAWWMTGSVALLSDALESIVNVAAAVAAFLAITYSARPPDANHPYGHHKAEYFSSVLEGVLIVVAAIAIIREAWSAWFTPRMIDAPWTGLAVNALATAVNGAWCWVLLRHGRKRRSPALVADGRHLLADVVSSVGVFAGVSLAALTGWLVLDPLLAALVGVNILWSGWTLVKESVGGLMDQAPPPDEVERIREIISAHAEGALEAHDLRARHAGRNTFVDFHLVVPGSMSVSSAHSICDRIEAAIREEFGQTTITIHVEPEDKAKHTGVVVV